MATKLQRLMDRRPDASLSRGLKDESYPKFYPHVTLASLSLLENPDAGETIRRVVMGGLLESQEVAFRSVDSGIHHFRSVFVRAELTEELKVLHARVHEGLGIKPKTPEFPHMSLCYIADEDAEHGERQRFHDMMKNLSMIDDITGEFALDCGEQDWVSGFRAVEMWVVDCSGATADWQVLHKIQLSA